MTERSGSFLAWLRTMFRARQPYVASARPFQEIDSDRLRQDLRLEARGRADGERNEPAADATRPSAAEQHLIAFFEAEKTALLDDLLGQLKVYEDRIATLDFHAREGQITAIGGVAASRYLTVTRAGQNLLFRLREDVQGLRRELRAFQDRHGLSRLPHYPASRRFHWGVLLLLLAIETVLNGVFFARGNDLGLLGGTLQAVLFAAVNLIAACVLGGVFVRRCHHRSAAVRGAAVATSVVWAVGLVVYNLAVAHYREAVALDPLAAATRALQTFTTAPFGLTLFDSWMLLLVGCLFAGIAATEAFALDDAYPGYGPLDRRFRSAETDYRDSLGGNLAEVDAIRDHAVADLDGAARALEARRAEFHSIVQARNTLVSRFLGHLQHLEAACNTLLATYRDANRSARTAAPPAGFDQVWRIELNHVPDLTAVVTAGTASIDERVNSALARVDDQKRLVFTEHERAARVFRSLEELDSHA